jgi:hypothetical protein
LNTGKSCSRKSAAGARNNSKSVGSSASQLLYSRNYNYTSFLLMPLASYLMPTSLHITS